MDQFLKNILTIKGSLKPVAYVVVAASIKIRPCVLIKCFMELRCGFAISTYHRNTDRLVVFKTCITSVMSTKKDDTVVIIVDDGSLITEHLEWVLDAHPSVVIVRRPTNGGISKCKNTCLRELGTTTCDIFFLLDDDVEIVKSIENKYILAHSEDNVSILSASWPPYGNPCLGSFSANTCRTPLLNGFLLSLTAKTFRKAGFFKILPHKYGHEHVWYTYRTMTCTEQPCFLDISDGMEFYKILPGESSVPEDEKAVGRASNGFNPESWSRSEPCIE